MKNFLLFNQSFGTEGSPNQTDETLTRENRIGLMSYLRRTLMLFFAVLVMSIGNVWGTEYSGTVTFYKGSSKLTTSTITNSNASVTFTYTDLSANSSSGNICSTGSQYGIKGKNTKLITVTCPSGYYFKSAVFYLGSFGNTETPTAEIISGSTSLYSTSARKFVKIDACGEEFSCEDSISGFVANKYTTLTVKEKGNSKNLGVTKLVYTIESAAPSTKRIYMKAGDWNNDSPKFFVHSWGSSDSDVQLTALGGCESDVFYADIPSGNTSLIFTRQNPSTSSIIWDGSDLWNRTDNISISTYDLFTFATWNGGPSSRSTFTGGTYSPTTYTITYAANGGGGSMSATSGICPDADQAITSNAFTAPTGCASFAHWTANVAVKVGGATVAAGSPIANGATIEDINSNITLTAVWKLATPTIADNGDNTFSISGSIGGASYYYTTNGSTPTTSSSLYSSAVDFSAGETNITAKAIAHKTGYVDSDVASQACVYHEPPVCAISECGNATLTYVIKVGSSGSQATDGSDFITSATPSNSTALGASTSVGLSTITITDGTLKAAAATNACFGSKPNMTGKIGIYNGASYSSSNYLQFTFTVKEGYTFTPCDIQFIVQPVSHEASFRWEVTDGTNVYGYGTGSAPVGSGNGATVLTGITSPSAMEAGTYYIRLYPFYNGSNTFRLGTDVILKGTTAAAACVAPTTVNITGTYHYFPGETISLTAAAEGGSGTPTTYQWYKGGTADGNIIEGATSATYSKASCTFADAGSYYCKVTRGGSCSKFSDNYDVKILHLYVNTGRNGTPYNDVDFVKVDATTARATISLGASWDYGFNIADGCGHYYGNSGSMKESDCTGWTMNVDGTDCLMRTTNGATYTFTVDYTTLTAPVVSITYPSANQAADNVIYFDNNDRNWSTLHYRIGRTNHTQATAMNQVPGTANLYKVTTAAYNNFSGWHIANNAGWTGDDNSIYRTYTNGDAYSITYATAHEGGAVTESAVTVTPTTSRGNGSDVGINDNCEFYNYTITNGMKTQNVSITAPSNGTISVAYTDVEGASQSFTSGNRDLAHTVIITPTATPATGYNLGGLTINEVAHTSGNIYTVSENVTVAATFTAKTYSITLDRNGASSGSESVTMTYNSSSHTAITAPVKAGYTFDGWYDSETDNNGSGNLVMNASGVLQENVTGFTGAGGIWTKDATCTLYAKWTAKTTTITINANTANHGSTAPSPITATYGSALPSFTPAAGVSGYSLTGYYTDATSGTKVINADGTLVASTSYADGSSHWKYETATLTLYPQYEEEADACYEFTPATSGSAPSEGDVISGTGSGGTMVAGTGQSYTANGLKFESTGSNRYVTVTLDNNLKEGSVIAVTMWMDGTSENRGLNLQTSAGTQKAQWKFTADSENHEFSYTVEAGDGLINTNVFRLARINNVYLKTVTVSNCGDAVCTTPTTAFADGAYTIGGSALDLRTLISADQGAGAITFAVTSAGGTSASIAGDGYSFSATAAGTATITATKAANGDYCEKVMDATITVSAGGGCTPHSVVKTVLSSTTAGTTTGYNNDEYAGSATIVTFQGTPIDGGYKMQSGSKLFVTLKKGNFVEGDKINIVITKASDLPNTTGKLPIFYNASSPALLATIDAASAGTYTYTLTASDITTLGSNKTIGVFRSSSTTENNPYVKSVEVEGCRDWTVDETAPTFVSSVPANGATGVATSGTIVLTFSEALGTVDASKFTLTGATKGAVAIDGSDATKVNIAYSGAEEEATVTLATAAAAVSDLAGNALAAALSNISFTTAAAAPAGDCEELFAGRATSTSVFTPSAGSATFNLSSGNSFSAGGYSYSVKPNSSNAIVASPKAGGSFAAGDSLIVVIYNNESGSKTMGFRLGSGTYNTSVGSKKLHIFRQVLVASDISAGKVTFNRQSSDDRWVEIIIKHCGLLPSCTTPELPTLTAKTVCEGGDADAAWNAAITNSGSLVSGETVAYSWVKKGGSTPVSSVATYQPTDVTEAMAGTYVVTATVSADGKASKSASQEVDLTVTEGTEVTEITADKATVYPGNSVTLTATANTTATWQWYTCTNAEGAGEASIGGATSASYTIASAGAAGTYYYKAKATGSCGTAERVYTLVVSPAAGGDCFHFVSVLPAGDITVSSNTSLVTPTHATTLEGGTMKVGSSQMTIAKDYGLKLESSKYVTVTLESALEAGNVVIVKGTSGTKGYGITINGVNFYDADNKTFDVSYTVLADDGLVGKTSLNVTKYSGSSYLQEIKITGCGASCTDPEVTASADNTTACVGTSVTFTATGAHASATYQWQKLDGTWTDISGAEASTYNIPSVEAGDAGKYRVIASHACNRTSNEVTLSVPSVPDFGSTVPASVSVMQTIALSINTVEATDAVKYRWYKSADATWDAGDVEIGTNKELIKAYDGEAIGSPSYYIFCRAQNACGITTSDPIAVNVTAYVAEDCATKGNEGEAEFGFTNTGCSQGTYSETAVWTTNSRSKYLTYTAPEGKYLKTAKVTVAVSSGSKCGYAYSTDGGTTWTYAELASLSSTLTEKTINLNSLSGTINAFRISRNLQDGGGTDHGVTSGNFYLSKACFEYTDACTATTVTPSESSKTYEMDGSSFTEPTFTVKHGGTAFDPQPTLTYTSSNEDIASVDDDGTVTFNGEAGTVTITASYAGGAIALTEYCASQGSYTITVSCPGGAPKVVADGSVNMVGCNTSVTLLAKKQDGTAFADGTYQWFRNGEEIDGATSSSYTATQAGTYTVERTNGSGCTTPSTNSAIVTSTATEPEVERLVPFQYYHVDKTYSDQMKMRHLFAVKNSGKLDGKSFKMYVSRNGGEAADVTSSNALVVWPNADGHVDTVMVDLNKLSRKYSEDDELVFTCKAIDCSGNVSDVYKETITMNVIGATPTLALICSGSSKAGGTRKTGELTVGGDFLTGYNVADLCQQTGNTSFDANTEWGLYTDLKTQYIVTPVNGYAVFNKLNYEPFDILLLTDYPKASKSDAAADVLDDMAALCDYRPMLSFKTHMVAKSPSKWAEKGFTTSPVVTKADGRLNLNIVCYAHPMFEGLKSGDDVYTDVGNTSAPLVYTMLSGTGYESSKGMQGFELAAAENFVTIGLTHYNGTIAKDSPDPGEVEWTPGSEDRMLVTVAERQANPEARFILFSLNCGAQSKLTDKGEEVILACLNYLLGTAEGTIEPADCSFTFDNGDSNEHNDAWYASNCPLCTGTKGDGLWTTAANWGPDYRLLPGEFTSVRIKKPVEVNDEHAHVMEVRIIDEGSIDIPAGKALDVKSTIRRMDGTEIYPTEISDIHIGSASTGNGTLIFNNDEGDTKARVDMYSKGFIDGEGVKNYQYIGTPFIEVNALYNYYGSWIYGWGEKKNGNLGWVVVKNGGPMTAWTGYCITQEAPTTHAMSGTLTATGTVDINVPANANMVVGNSWTAPIDINALTTDDLEGLTANIYFFNTGVDKTGEAGAAGSRYAGSTYVTVPVHSAPYTGDDHINSLQGFFVKNTGGSAGTLHLDYERHVRKTTRDNILSDEMHAPARRTALSSDEPVVLKMKVSGENYDDKLLLLEREDFTEGFDNGWDGDKWDGNESALYIYTTDNNGTENSVSAMPQLEGTIIGFRAGEDDAYTLNFEYLNSDETLYLYDVENNTYTQIMTGMTYRFFTTDNEKHARFIITRSNGQEVATGVESTSGSLDRSKAKKLLIEDKMFIMVNGMLYDATGKVVK